MPSYSDDINAGLVGTSEDGIIVAFRGTLGIDFKKVQTLLDWLNNFNAEPVAVDGLKGKVHKGFYDSVQSLWGDSRC